MSNPTITPPTSLDSTWPEPIPFSERVNLPDFPIQAFPSWLGQWAEQLARVTENPIDGPAAMSLAAVSAALAGKVEVQLTRNWVEPLALYIIIAMTSGRGKSPIYRATVEPLHAYQREQVELSRELIAEEQTQRDVFEMALRKAKSEAAAAGGSDLRLNAIVAECQRRFNAARVRCTTQLLATDVTPQGLIRTFVEQNERIAILTDEGEIVDALSGNKGLDIFLKAYDGVQYSKNLAGKPPVNLNHPTLVIGAMVQPTLLNKMLANGELVARGLLARCILIQPPRPLGIRKRDQLEIPSSVQAAYHRNMRQLLELTADTDDNGRQIPNKLTFLETARDVLVDYRRKMDEIVDTEQLSAIHSFAEKHTGRIARVAGMLHIARNGLTEPVPAGEVEGAIQLGDYFLAHTKAAYLELEVDPVAHLANRIVRWVSSKGIRSLSRTTCNVVLRPKNGSELDAAIDLLIRSNHLRTAVAPTESHGPGRQPSPAYDVNPRLLGVTMNSINSIFQAADNG